MTREAGWMLRRLPIAFQDDRVMAGLLGVLESVAESVQLHADQIPHLADPTVTPEALLSWLGRFVDAPDSETLPVEDRRDLLARTGALILRKGTRDHLATLISPFVSEPVSIVEDGGIHRLDEAPPCEGRVTVAVGGITHGTPSDLVKLMRSITPAHCVVDLVVAGVPAEVEG
ncbi:MAG: phage tail protein [Ilumatobacteraceae bacterium]|jgi:phage tail-like protein